LDMSEFRYWAVFIMLLLVDAFPLYALGRSGTVGTFGYDLSFLAGALAGVCTVLATSYICMLGDAYGWVSED